MDIKVGDRVRIKNDLEFAETEGWVCTESGWRFEDAIRVCVIRRKFINKDWSVIGVDATVALFGSKYFSKYFPITEVLTLISPSKRYTIKVFKSAIAEILTKCECSMEKFGFEWHEKWCPEWSKL